MDSAVGEYVEQLDVLVIGAGISGIGAGRYLRTYHPDKTFAMLEARAASGGTWDLFRYPGIRSDSDLNTFGYDFKPWQDSDSIASGDKILAYLREAAAENGLDPLIRYQHRVLGASWSSECGRWSVDVETRDAAGTPTLLSISARWIFCAAGYYRYDAGYAPLFEGQNEFTGQIVHPQQWPADLDYAGKKVAIIGSGATAVTLLPAMATGPDAAERVTMVQRTPSYVMSVSRQDKTAILLKRLFGEERGYALARRKDIVTQQWIYQFCQRHPLLARKIIRWANAKELPAGYDVDTHFNPPYNPWEQRLCAVPDGDLFQVIRDGKAEVVTDRIERFTTSGIELVSGRQLEADIIVTATGLNLNLLGDIKLDIDGEPVSLPDTVVYRGMMFSGVPNLAFAVGYTNSSWTLKIGLLCQYFCQLLSYMDDNGYNAACAVADPGMPTRPLMDFGAGYVKRSLDQLPRPGTTPPWSMSTSFRSDEKLLGAEVADEYLKFNRIPQNQSAAKAPS
ncbi:MULTISPECIES: NAD(P)/FAD-dependent oxidoreductase [unclassified Mycolicibacterium]|uniref:flavin-containing monooxygenase n=1 Tax=unclassified Mycolicibacterium TaxID=2636767 RepID=UPI0012DCDD95|nr:MULTISPECIES: NAD(P)/FAD-dependent oxidoreductase [unclassified Mycolicibacterium]MUL82265.1 NAD(P)/FAD-dependent oxidoreductase [Mycolicibacterium sp. CBMA 329]MUL88031.1 NAD(P)/FAD-dependent oxidoreductase [Mycolicibacterium sp. CBMA 331]MUM02362.1 NAD(P)/FAD-dependent oxidoreductase [Mycolicibacterium sp. CBMA 334]MUM29118.1 NAD(P)/FAD-dependent oxidoreductase [Mycolicibacterium sp. CBMA 295]MUM38328.1 NAD(P)/FAD-dependent oxidoreductase [Mycolicibacterium sp. CBMA 247]